jgi:hypothetical protein
MRRQYRHESWFSRSFPLASDKAAADYFCGRFRLDMEHFQLETKCFEFKIKKFQAEYETFPVWKKSSISLAKQLIKSSEQKREHDNSKDDDDEKSFGIASLFPQTRPPRRPEILQEGIKDPLDILRSAFPLSINGLSPGSPIDLCTAARGLRAQRATRGPFSRALRRQDRISAGGRS